ncbi:MAG TPA: hypothetical protein VGF55_16945 [Gemmataceae bacterium]|jgi:hypothetical protein
MPTDDTLKPLTDDVVIVNNFNINHDPEDLVRYKGQYVAWSEDGRHVLFAADDIDGLFRLVDGAGLPPGTYVIDCLKEHDGIPEFGWRVLD